MYLIVLFIILANSDTVISAEITTFSATVFNIPTITNDSVTLNVELSNCSSACPCHVVTNKTGHLVLVNFLSGTTKGSATIKNLQPYTWYSFDINCSEVMHIKTYAIRTDVFRPSPPRNAQITLNGQHLQLTWTPPAVPQGPIDTYRVTVDGAEVELSKKTTKLSYEMNEDYVPGVTHTMNVRACNIDAQNRTLCSNLKDAEVTYCQSKINDSSIRPPTQAGAIHTFSCIFILLIPTLIVI